MVTKKEEENWEVKAFFVAGGGDTFGPFTEKNARAEAARICAEGCDKEGTYYPPSQIAKVKAYQLP